MYLPILQIFSLVPYLYRCVTYLEPLKNRGGVALYWTGQFQILTHMDLFLNWDFFGHRRTCKKAKNKCHKNWYFKSCLLNKKSWSYVVKLLWIALAKNDGYRDIFYVSYFEASSIWQGKDRDFFLFLEAWASRDVGAKVIFLPIFDNIESAYLQHSAPWKLFKRHFTFRLRKIVFFSKTFFTW